MHITIGNVFFDYRRFMFSIKQRPWIKKKTHSLRKQYLNHDVLLIRELIILFRVFLLWNSYNCVCDDRNFNQKQLLI